MGDVPSDYAHKRGVWSMSCPSVAMIYIHGREAYDTAMREWRAAEPYALIADQIMAKPATPEPPEWVSPTITIPAEGMSADISRETVSRVKHCCEINRPKC